MLSGAVDIEMAMPCWARATGKLARSPVTPSSWDTGQSVTFPSDIENLRTEALLSEPGEWYADVAAGPCRRNPAPLSVRRALSMRWVTARRATAGLSAEKEQPVGHDS